MVAAKIVSQLYLLRVLLHFFFVRLLLLALLAVVRFIFSAAAVNSYCVVCMGDRVLWGGDRRLRPAQHDIRHRNDIWQEWGGVSSDLPRYSVLTRTCRIYAPISME